jgi:sugar phosphate isomerase/epimerase
MKLSVTTFPWGKLDTPRKLSIVLSKIKEIGFEGVGLEYGLLPQALKDRPELIKPLVEKSGLENQALRLSGSQYTETRNLPFPN